MFTILGEGTQLSKYQVDKVCLTTEYCDCLHPSPASHLDDEPPVVPLPGLVTAHRLQHQHKLDW